MTKKTQSPGELVFGVHPILELLKSKRRKILSLYTTRPEPKSFALIKRYWPTYPVTINYVDRDVLAKIAGTTDHQSLVAWAQPFPMRKKFFEPAKQPIIVMLDGIQDPRNLGAILRSAFCTKVDGIIITTRASAPLNAVALKSSAGLAEHIEIYQSPSPQAAALECAKAGYNLYLATFEGKNALACEFKEPMCLVIGGEGFGISKEILNSGTQITLPQRTPDISYNASVAAGILLFLIATKQNKI